MPAWAWMDACILPSFCTDQLILPRSYRDHPCRLEGWFRRFALDPSPCAVCGVILDNHPFPYVYYFHFFNPWVVGSIPTGRTT